MSERQNRAVLEYGPDDTLIFAVDPPPSQRIITSLIPVGMCVDCGVSGGVTLFVTFLCIVWHSHWSRTFSGWLIGVSPQISAHARQRSQTIWRGTLNLEAGSQQKKVKALSSFAEFPHFLSSLFKANVCSLRI